MSTTNTLLALAAGAALGAVAGILLAPASGKETRKNLLKSGEKLRDELGDLVDQGKNLVDEAMGVAKNAAAQASNMAHGAVDEMKNGQQQARSAAQKA